MGQSARDPENILRRKGIANIARWFSPSLFLPGSMRRMAAWPHGRMADH
jgi:hypothetical protein